MRAALRVLATAILFVSSQAFCTTPEERSAIDTSERLTEAGKHADALKVLLPHQDSQAGEVEFALAHAYMNAATIGKREGKADPVNARHAIRFAKRAAAHGQGGGYNILYMIYGNGWGVPLDRSVAADYLVRGVKSGDLGAKVNYAISLYDGSDILEKDIDKACPIILELLQDDKIQAVVAYQAGQILFRGECGKKADKVGGMRLVEIAANHGVRSAQRDMGRSLEEEWLGRADHEKALEWYEKAAASGDGFSLWRLGMSYIEGDARPRDSVRAVGLFRKSADAGHPYGMASLGTMYASGDGLKKDFAQAKALYERSAAAGNAHAYRELAVIYMQGEGVEVDLQRAGELYRRAVAEGLPEDAALAKVLAEKLEEAKQAAPDRTSRQ